MQPASTSPAPRRGSAGRSLLVLFLLAAAFAGGFVPQWLQTRALREELKTTGLQFRLSTAHRRLGVASHEAQRNNYASAAEAARQFFGECAAIAQTEAFTDEPRTLVALQRYAEQRDPVMAMLAAADPAVKEQLGTLYLTMDGVLSRRP